MTLPSRREEYDNTMPLRDRPLYGLIYWVETKSEGMIAHKNFKNSVQIVASEKVERRPSQFYLVIFLTNHQEINNRERDASRNLHSKPRKAKCIICKVLTESYV